MSSSCVSVSRIKFSRSQCVSSQCVTESHSEHRFPAPSLKEGCRKPVLGVWEGRSLPARADREDDVSGHQQRSVGIVSSGAPSDAGCSAAAAVPQSECCCCKTIVSEKCTFETVNRFAPASLHFAETTLPSAAVRTGTGRRFAATRNQHFSEQRHKRDED